MTQNRHPTKFSDADIARIREQAASGRTQTAIAREYGTTQSYVSKVVRHVSRSEHTNAARERYRRAERETVAKRRAALDPEEKAARRREADRRWREENREKRREYERERYARRRAEGRS